ncbi:DUF2793 domain-containing protein [Luteimonas saliphila]|uniref:DUF2793 domain-containing protein n=1 Tax=Luteimonas saliphila TaxID=2804919 RepID=UPI00192D599A|nr:DUF2793 domain-containing protein [Luteimonas saliphila]
MSVEPRTNLSFWPPGAMQPDLVFNAMIFWLAVWAQGVVLSQENDPPGSPDPGDTYLVQTGTGAWAGQDDNIAYWDGFQWKFFVPGEGYFVRDLDADVWLTYSTGSGWTVWAGSGGDLRNTTTAITSGTTVTIDLSQGDYFTLTLAHNATVAFSNPPGSGKGFSVRLRVTQDGTGGRSLTQPAAVKLTDGSDLAIQSGAGVVTLVHYTSDNNGTSIDATIKARGV